MGTSFDKAAGNYDETFTHSVIGQLQRQLVYTTLSKHLVSIQNLLEINCGTGEDAIWLAQQDIKVTATDISPKMIEIAKSKGHYEHLTFSTVAINSIATTFDRQKFDMIFSNFGGLNCLSPKELKTFFQTIPSILSDKGTIAFVIMPQNTLWEQFYFFSKARFSEIFRRKKAFVIANVDGEKVTTFYYNPKDIVNLAKSNFETIAVAPIGFFVPPSYLDSFFKNKSGLLQWLHKAEKKIKQLSFLSKYADHYLIVLQKR